MTRLHLVEWRVQWSEYDNWVIFEVNINVGRNSLVVGDENVTWYLSVCLLVVFINKTILFSKIIK